uniref:IS200/IS605 family transposase n=1 Tax=Larkinella humicola TaxID=2607654 RepID=UPI001CDA3F50|nr:IS200/IS605 family transposase [Larkinella humicola]
MVFAVKGRHSLIPREHKEELHRYATGIVHNRGAKLLAIHCMPDHVHLLVGFSPTLTIASLVKDIKTATSAFIKENAGHEFHFTGRKGMGLLPILILRLVRLSAIF